MTLTARRRRRCLPGQRFRATLPGPERGRWPKRYEFELVFVNENAQDIGCLGLWNVRGGRIPYQVALERTETGRLHWHCTCADAVYRGEQTGRPCKHVRAVMAVRRQGATGAS